MERYEEREKRRDERAVRQAKMDEWQAGGVAAKAPKPEKVADAHKDGRLFKIFHEKEDFEKTLKDDLKLAARNSVHRRNRSPDDGFQLVGDRRKNVMKVALPSDNESSEAEENLSVSEMMQECKNNAMRIHLEQEKLARREKRKQARDEAERKDKRRADKHGHERHERRPPGEERKRKHRPQQAEDLDVGEMLF